MAKAKSTSDGKTPRTRKSEAAANSGSAAGVSEVKAVTPETTPAAVAPAAVKAAPEPRKLEMVKTEPRKNVVVPIKLEDEIRRRAYELYVQRGNAPGSAAEDWLTAEREVRQRYQKQQSA
jgi:hypothetical protein